MFKGSPLNQIVQSRECLAPCLLLEQVQFFMKHFLGETMTNPPSSANSSILPPEVELSLMKAESVKGLTSAMIGTAAVDVIRDDREINICKEITRGWSAS